MKHKIYAILVQILIIPGLLLNGIVLAGGYNDSSTDTAMSQLSSMGGFSKPTVALDEEKHSTDSETSGVTKYDDTGRRVNTTSDTPMLPAGDNGNDGDSLLSTKIKEEIAEQKADSSRGSRIRDKLIALFQVIAAEQKGTEEEKTGPAIGYPAEPDSNDGLFDETLFDESGKPAVTPTGVMTAVEVGEPEDPDKIHEEPVEKGGPDDTRLLQDPLDAYFVTDIMEKIEVRKRLGADPVRYRTMSEGTQDPAGGMQVQQEVTEYWDAFGNDIGSKLVEYKYDEEGSKIRETQTWKDNEGNTLSMEVLVLDDDGNIIAVLDPCDGPEAPPEGLKKAQDQVTNIEELTKAQDQVTNLEELKKAQDQVTDLEELKKAQDQVTDLEKWGRF